MESVLVLVWKDCEVREIQLRGMLVSPDRTPPQGVVLILDHNCLTAQSLSSQLLDDAVLVDPQVLDHNLSALDTPAVEAAKVHSAAPVRQADKNLVSMSD